MEQLNKKIICIIGPTATRKTEIAVSLVEKLPVAIISVDSAMVYRGMNIGTAKPEATVLKKAPHHLIDICDPSEIYSAANFRSDALQLIEDILKRDRIPLLVGGTMLYFQALLQGISVLPEANASLRRKIEQEAEIKGWEVMHQQLKDIDPMAAKKIHPNDAQRIQRALEVFLVSGKSLTEHQKNKPQGFSYSAINLAFIPEDRNHLHQLIESRFFHMLEQGFIDEVKILFQRKDLSSHLPSMRIVGYRQIWDYLAGKCDFEVMKYQAICKTRQFAKRQLTWLRHWSLSMQVIEPYQTHLLDEVMKYLNNSW